MRGRDGRRGSAASRGGSTWPPCREIGRRYLRFAGQTDAGVRMTAAARAGGRVVDMKSLPWRRGRPLHCHHAGQLVSAPNCLQNRNHKRDGKRRHLGHLDGGAVLRPHIHIACPRSISQRGCGQLQGLRVQPWGTQRRGTRRGAHRLHESNGGLG